MSSDTVPANLLGKMIGYKNSLARMSSQESHSSKLLNMVIHYS